MNRSKPVFLSLLGCLVLGAGLAACHMFLDGHWGYEGTACDNNLQCSGDLVCIGGWCRDYDQTLECDNNQECQEFFGPEAFCNDAWMCDYRPIREFWPVPCSENAGICADEEQGTCAAFPAAEQSLGEANFCAFPCLNPLHCPPDTACSRIENEFVCAPTEFTGELGVMCQQVQDCPVILGSTETPACIKPEDLASTYGICSVTCIDGDQTSCPPGYECCPPNGETQVYCVPPDLCPP